MSDPQMHGRSVDEKLCRQFESAWAEGRPESIERFLPAEDDPAFLATLEEMVCIELELRWKSWALARREAKELSPDQTPPVEETIAGPLSVETYLRRFPPLDRPEIIVRLAKHECFVRQQFGQTPSGDEYRNRFPDLSVVDEEFESGIPMMSQRSLDGEPPEAVMPGMSHDSVGDGLDETLPNARLGASSGPDLALGRFGNYELLEEIGRGGMGVVYRARQITADRIVGLKVIRRDRFQALPRDSKSTALDRFRHEAQAAAKLEHENIVTVYEVGDVDDQPFFSMRYVEGRSLAEIVSDGPLENRRAAAYLEPTARAVHEAHCQGVLHRDLKPQNVLVDAKSDRALVADFGLAKLSEGDDQLTRAGEVMGTPSYMSPEQGEDSSRVTAASDTYGLGATLYHLLCGRPPFQAATPVETLRQVIDSDPVPPRRLDPSIDRDLETICLKSLNKEPSRRYATTEALADDLRRYLDGEPILARPVSAVERAYRWCRRNRALATLASMVAVSLIGLLVVIVLAYVQTSAALAQSEAGFQKARSAVNDLFTEISEEDLLHEPGMQRLRRKLLSKAQEYYQDLLARGSNDPRMRDELAMAHFRLGKITGDIDTPEKALESYELARTMQVQLAAEDPQDRTRSQNLADTLIAIGRTLYDLGRLEKARDNFQQARDERERLTRVAPEEHDFQRKLANSHMNLGIFERDCGNFDQSRAHQQKAQGIRNKLIGQGVDDPAVQRDCGMGHFNLAILANVEIDAQANREEAEKAKKTAQREYELAIEQFRQLHEAHPDNLSYRYQLAMACRLLAALKQGLIDRTPAKGMDGKALQELEKEVEDLFAEARLHLETLTHRNPAMTSYQGDLARLNLEEGKLLARKSELGVQHLRDASTTLDRLAAYFPEVRAYRQDLAATLRELGRTEIIDGRHWLQEKDFPSAKASIEAARKNLRRSEELFNELLKEPHHDDYIPAQLDETTDLLKRLDKLEAGMSRET